jgi:hypothetical protein
LKGECKDIVETFEKEAANPAHLLGKKYGIFPEVVKRQYNRFCIYHLLYIPFG